MSKQDVAIIGIGGRFPQANDLTQFISNLESGRDSVDGLSYSRMSDTSLPFKDYHPMSFLEDIDKFDHSFFKISKGEAENMDPHQRILLEVAYETFENAGYDFKEFSGTKTGVYAACPEINYYPTLIDHFDATLLTGNLNSVAAGRIARFFNLQGPAIQVNTACSSSLVAIHMACNDIKWGEVDQALVCAGRLIILPAEKGKISDIGILSPTGKARAFDETANGTTGGEGFGAVLLKPLEKAKKDKDIIHAVIKGSSVNQDADRSSFLTAPSREAQTQVIVEAWKKAEIAPEDVTYIEAHGTGTKIGDPIEISALTAAFRSYTIRKHFCAISSVKTNIGHADAAAGIIGLLKVVAALKTKKLFPSLHFKVPNPLVNFENAPVYVNDRLREWNHDPTKPRLAGVSSFGLSGTNCHIVLQEANATHIQGEDTKTYIFPFSAKTSSSLTGILKKFREHLNAYKDDLLSTSFTLTGGRSHYDYRQCFVASNHETLERGISQYLDEDPIQLTSKVQKQFILLLSDDLGIEKSTLDNLFITNQQLEIDYHQFIQTVGTEDEAKSLAIQYCLFNVVNRIGIVPKKLMGAGGGKILTEVLMGQRPLTKDLIQLTKKERTAEPAFLKRLEDFVTRESSKYDLCFVDFGYNGMASRVVKTLIASGLSNIQLLTIDTLDALSNQERLCKKLYDYGFVPDWKKYWKNSTHQKIELPTYQFEKERCWPIAPTQLPDANSNKLISEEAQNTSPKKFTDNTTVEEVIKAIWNEVLKPKELTLDSDFFDLGGNSLNGTQVINHLSKHLDVTLQFEDLLDNGTVNELTGFIKKLKSSSTVSTDFVSIESGEEQEYYDVSDAQRRLWVIDQIEGKSAAYNIPMAYHLYGFEPTLLIESINEVVNRHEILRTSFIKVKGMPKQRIKSAEQLGFDVVIEELPLTVTETEISSLTEKEALETFDLQHAPLFRVKIFNIPNKGLLLVLTMHHIISDLWSLAVFVNEILHRYGLKAQRLPSPFEKLEIQYKDFSRWQTHQLQGERLRKIQDYWVYQFADKAPVLNLPLDNPRPPIKSFNGATSTFAIDSTTLVQLNKLAKKENSTLFMLLLASVKTLFYRYTGQQDIVIGSAVAGRSHIDLESQIGFYINTLALRTKFHGEKPFMDLLHRVKQVVLNGLINQAFPYDRLVDELNLERDLSRSPLFDVMVDLQNAEVKESYDINLLKNVSAEERKITYNTSKFDVHFAFHELEDQLVTVINYNTDLFSKDRINRMFSHWNNLIRGILSNPSTPLCFLDYLSTAELQQVLSFGKGRRMELTHRSVTDVIEASITKNSEAVAISCQGVKVTYGELSLLSNKLAHHLKQTFEVQKEEPVGIFMPHNELAIVAMLGILKAGAVFLPLDLNLPSKRLSHILQDADVKVVLTQSEYIFNLTDSFSGTLFAMDIQLSSLEDAKYEPLSEERNPEDLAYVIYTSGSTGVPKGVGVRHSNFLNYLMWANDYYFKNKTGYHFAVFTSFAFDLTLTSIFSTLARGDKMTLFDGQESNGTLEQIFDQNSTIDVVKLTPSHVSMLEFLNVRQTNIKCAILGGEKLSIKQVNTLLQLNESMIIYNEYGPTETTVGSTVDQLDANYDGGSIGKPIANTKVLILDEHLRPVPICTKGELYLGGVGVSRGYINSPTLTSEKFIKNPFNPSETIYRTGDIGSWTSSGQIKYIGRLDSQVKIRGNRIDISEIEETMLKLSLIEQVVVMIKDKDTEPYLVAYYTGSEIESSVMRKFLSNNLLSYAHPYPIVYINQFPVNQNGKVDFDALPDIDQIRIVDDDEYEAPRNSFERQIAVVWEEVLQVDKIGINESFFQLGGNSLKAIQVISRLNEYFPKGISISSLFINDTIKQLADLLMADTETSVATNTEDDYEDLEF